MSDGPDKAQGYMPGVKQVVVAYGPATIRVCEPPGYEGEYVTVPRQDFDPRPLAPVKLRREGRPIYALKETADEASERLAAQYNELLARQKDKAI